MVTRAGCHVTCNKLAGQFITQRERERVENSVEVRLLVDLRQINSYSRI